MTRRLMLLACLMASLTTTLDGQQRDPGLAVALEGYVVRSTGGESPSAGMSTGPLALGQETKSHFVHRETMCGFGVGGRIPADPSDVTSWTAAVTPTRIDGDSVTFRLTWTRVKNEGKPVTQPMHETQLTLRNGESFPIDTVAIDPSSRLWRDCHISALTLRAKVQPYLREGEDRRLVATDLWLVEHLPGGGERSLQTVIRGLYNQPSRFYFDAIADGANALDFFGTFTASPDGNDIRLALETRSRLVLEKETSTTMPARVANMPGLMTSRKVESSVRLSPTDVVDLELPRLSENDSGAFANRTYSIRIRSRQIR